MKVLDERFLKPSEASLRWEAGKQQCLQCKHVIAKRAHWDVLTMRCQAVKWGTQSTFCIEARDTVCRDGALFEPRPPKQRPAEVYRGKRQALFT